MRAGNAFSELSTIKPNSSSINKTINTRNNKTSSRIDLEQTDTQKSTSTNQLTKPPRIVGTEGFTDLGHFRIIAYLVESSKV